VYLNFNGTGSFSRAPNSPFIVGGSGLSLNHDVAIGDLTGDGRPDIVQTVGGSSSSAVAVLPGLGAGDFGSRIVVPVGFRPHTIALGDLNGDGLLDLATANSSSVSVVFRNGASGFGPPTHILFTGPTSVAIGDLNGDGDADLAVTLGTARAVALVPGNGSGGFAPPITIPISDGPFVQRVAIGDVTGDGRPDLVTANGSNISALFGNGRGAFSNTLRSPFTVFEDTASFVVLGDFNRDGLMDVIVPGEVVTVLLNHPSF
jgi:hypothetical protein